MSASINLLPLDLRQERVSNRKGLFLRGLALLTLLFLVIATVWITGELSRNEKKLAILQEELLRLQPDVVRAEQAKKELDSLLKESGQMQGVLNQRRLWGAILDGMGDRLPRDVWLSSLEVDQAGSFKISGMAGSLGSVGIFIFELNRLPDIKQSALKSAEMTGEEGLIRFVLTGMLSGGGGERAIQPKQKGKGTP